MVRVVSVVGVVGLAAAVEPVVVVRLVVVVVVLLLRPPVKVEGGGSVFLVLASKTLKTLAPPQTWAGSPGQGILQSSWFSVHDVPTKLPHQQSVPALTPTYRKPSAKHAASHLVTVSWLPSTLVMSFYSVYF